LRDVDLMSFDLDAKTIASAPLKPKLSLDFGRPRSPA
jgi:hypothetical protein